MSKYYIAVEEVRSTVVEVEAETADKAIEIAENAYCEDVICLNDTDYIDDGTQFYDETDRWTEATELGLTNFMKLEAKK